MNLVAAAQTTGAWVLSLLLVGFAFLGGVALVTTMHSTEVKPILVRAYPLPVTLAPDALSAKSALLYDPTDGRVLFSKNAQKQLPLASLTKLMTAEVVLEHVAPTTVVRITQKDLEAEGDWGLRVGDMLPLSDLLKFGLVASSNDAIAAAAASLGGNYLNAMNDTANDLGLTKTYFLNPTGLDVNGDSAGAYGSAYDVARLATAFYKRFPHYFELTAEPSVSVASSGRTLTAAATAAPLLGMPGLIGAKTGFTDLAGGNLVAIVDVEIGHPLVAVVLGSTESGRFDDIRTLMQAIRSQKK